MKRGEVYWNNYHDAMGRNRRVPVVVLSEDGYNGRCMFVTGVRMVQYDNNPCPQHVHVPGSAFSDTITMTDCVALCETISSIRQTSLQGPIAVVNSAYYMGLIMDGVKNHIGLKTETNGYMDGVSNEKNPNEPSHVISERPTQEHPWYSVSLEASKPAEESGEGE